MDCLTYLKKITKDGTFAVIPRGMMEQRTVTTGNDGHTNNGITIVSYKSESISEAKREEKLVEQISMLVLNTPKDNNSVKRFYNHCMQIVPKDFRNGVYGKTEWTEFILSMALTISSILTGMVIKERHWKGADTLLKVLTTRIEAWNSRIQVESDDEGKIGRLIIEGF